MLFHDIQSGHVHTLKHRGNEFVTGAVERRVGHGKTFGKRVPSFEHFVEICRDNVVSDILDFSALNVLFKRSGSYVERIDLVDIPYHFQRARVCELATVRAVYFVTVVLRRVVRSCDHYSDIGLGFAGYVRKERRGHQFFRDKSLYAVSREYFRHRAGEKIGVYSAVARNGSARPIVLFHTIRNALRDLADRIHVQTVRARAEFAAKSGSAELEVLVERVDPRVFVCFERFKPREYFRVRRAVFPFVKFFVDVSHSTSCTLQSEFPLYILSIFL